MKFLQRIGALTFTFLATVGRISSFTATALSHAVRPPFYPRIIGQQMIEIGFFSLPVVGLTAVFAALRSFESEGPGLRPLLVECPILGVDRGRCGSILHALRAVIRRDALRGIAY